MLLPLSLTLSLSEPYCFLLDKSYEESLNLKTFLLSLGDRPSANLPADLGESRKKDLGEEPRKLGVMSQDLLITEDGRNGEINRLKTVILE